MTTEHDAYRASRPRLGVAFFVMWAIGGGGFAWALWDQSQQYYRLWPTGRVQFAALYWLCLFLTWVWMVYVDVNDEPELVEFDARRKLPVFDRMRRLPPVEPAAGIADIDRRRDAVMVEYGAYLSDIVQIAAMPLLADPQCPQTDRFTERLVLAEDARAAALRDEAGAGAYQDAVRALEKAWREARSFAARKGYSTLPAPEQDAVRRAQRLLDVALDESAFPAERREAMRKAISLLSEVVEVPAQSVTAIGHRVHRAEITDGPAV